jgi:hypothetical protein
MSSINSIAPLQLVGCVAFAKTKFTDKMEPAAKVQYMVGYSLALKG